MASAGAPSNSNAPSEASRSPRPDDYGKEKDDSLRVTKQHGDLAVDTDVKPLEPTTSSPSVESGGAASTQTPDTSSSAHNESVEVRK